jgi:uncharacterized membrane protein YqiK
MTEKQYENLMYALSTLIALEKKKHIPQAIPGIKYDVIKQQEKERLKNEAEEIYKYLTGSPSNREVKHTDFMKEAVREVEEQRKAALARQAAFEEEEKAKQAEQAELERRKNEELAKREANRVTDTDYLNGE